MSKCEILTEVGRRRFLRGAGFAAASAATIGVTTPVAKAKPGAALLRYPSHRLGNLRDLVVDQPMDISYPDADSPGILVRFGVAVEGGAGPEQDVVGFSTRCPHKGFPLRFSASDRTLSCPGHYSRFDCEKAGQQIWGHATQNLPQFYLRVDSGGEIFAEGADELIHGRWSNIL